MTIDRLAADFTRTRRSLPVLNRIGEKDRRQKPGLYLLFKELAVRAYNAG